MKGGNCTHAIHVGRVSPGQVTSLDTDESTLKRNLTRVMRAGNLLASPTASRSIDEFILEINPTSVIRVIILLVTAATSHSISALTPGTGRTAARHAANRLYNLPTLKPINRHTQAELIHRHAFHDVNVSFKMATP